MVKRRVRRRSPRFSRFRSRRKSKSINILPILGAVAGTVGSFDPQYTSIASGAQKLMNGEWSMQTMGDCLLGQTIGWNPAVKRWMWPSFTVGLLGGYIAHKAVSATGANRMLPKVMGYKINL